MRMIGDEKYYRWLETNASKTAYKYGVEGEDLLQDFFLSTLEGHTAKFEYVFYDSIRKEFQRGVTGKRDAADFTVDDSVLVNVRENRRGMTDYEFIEYLCDLRSIVNDSEWKMVCMCLMGFESYEIYQQSKDMSRRELAALWKRLGVRRGIA